MTMSALASTEAGKKPMALERGAAIAEHVVGQLRQFCDRIEIAGSIRRGLATVGDVDIVMLPKPGAMERIRARIAERCRIEVDGPQCMRAWLTSGEMLDLWFAHGRERRGLFGEETPGNFGTLFLCRTGSTDHNKMLATRAKAGGMKWRPHEGLFAGPSDDADWLAGEHKEEEIFDALKLRFVPPEKR